MISIEHIRAINQAIERVKEDFPPDDHHYHVDLEIVEVEYCKGGQRTLVAVYDIALGGYTYREDGGEELPYCAECNDRRVRDEGTLCEACSFKDR